MIISYHGKQGFKIQQGQTVLGVNLPHNNTRTGKGPRFKCDIILACLLHSDFAPPDITELSDIEGGPFTITGPGEYEVSDVVVRGYSTPANYDDLTLNTLYMIQWDGIRLCAVGALSGIDNLAPEVREAMAETDILLVPIGGGSVITSEEAYKLAVKAEPSLIIPCSFDNDGALDHFLKEGGEDKITKEDKITVKKKDLEGLTGKIRVLEAQ